MSKSSIIKNSAIIMILTIISKITGFFRDILVASAYGTTYETDAYNISLTIPTFAFAVIGTAVATIFIPIFTRILNEEGREKMYAFANKILIILFAIILILYFVLYLQTENIVKILAPNLDEGTIYLTIKLAKICMVNLFFLAIYSVFSAILQSLQEFTSVTLVGIVISIPIILYVLLFNNGIVGLTVVNVIGYIFQVIVQVPCLIRNKYRFSISFDFKDKIFKDIPKLLLPVAIGVGINQVNTLVDQSVASGLKEGTISAISLSNKVDLIVYGVYATAILTAIYPVLASEVGEMNVFKKHISKGICSISLVIIPSSVGIMVLSREIVTILFKRGIFDENSVQMTSTAVFFLAIGIIFYSIRDIISKAFYSLQDTITPMKNCVAGVCVNIVLDIELSKFMGIGGLSLATSLSAITTALLLYISLKKRIGNIFEDGYSYDLIKIIISSSVMGLLVYLFRGIISYQSKLYLIISFLLVVCVGIFIYMAMLKMLKTGILEEQVNVISKKIKIYFFKRIKNNKGIKDIYTYENKNK